MLILLTFVCLHQQPVATVASMPQPKPVVSEAATVSEGQSVPPLNTASILQQITQQQQQLNLFQTLLLNQYSGSTPTLPPGTDPLLQALPGNTPEVNPTPAGNLMGLGRGMPAINNPLGNYLLPGLLPLLENFNLKQDGPKLPTHPGLGRGGPNHTPDC